MLMVLDRSELTVRVNAGVIQVYKDDALLQRAAIHLLEMLVVYGNPLAESSVWRELAQAGVPAVILAARGGQACALLAEGLATQLPARRLQYACAEDGTLARQLARWVLVRKVLSYRLPYLFLAEHCDSDVANRFRLVLEQAPAKLHKVDALDSFMGIEGQVSREWFQLLSNTLPEYWKFTGRNRQPPRDPLNALLSLGYTQLYSLTESVVHTVGLLPWQGFYHQPRGRHAVLASDLMEPFRHLVERSALSMVARGEIVAADFRYTPERACLISDAARRKFLALLM